MGSLVRTACCVEVIRVPLEASDEEWSNAVETLVTEAIDAVKAKIGRYGHNFSAYSVDTSMLPGDGNPQRRCMVTVVVGFENSDSGY